MSLSKKEAYKTQRKGSSPDIIMVPELKPMQEENWQKFIEDFAGPEECQAAMERLSSGVGVPLISTNQLLPGNMRHASRFAQVGGSKKRLWRQTHCDQTNRLPAARIGLHFGRKEHQLLLAKMESVATECKDARQHRGRSRQLEGPRSSRYRMDASRHSVIIKSNSQRTARREDFLLLAPKSSRTAQFRPTFTGK